LGFGKASGANNAHCACSSFRLRGRAARVCQDHPPGAAPVFCGIALVKDQPSSDCGDRGDSAENIGVGEENRLFSEGRSCSWRALPFEEIDLLIVDRMGKDISGSVLDTNVIGRDIAVYFFTSLRQSSPPRAYRASSVTRPDPASSGHGTGIGMADLPLPGFVKALNLQYTYMNGLLALACSPAKFPFTSTNDREAIQAALASLAEPSTESCAVVRIAITSTSTLPGFRNPA